MEFAIENLGKRMRDKTNKHIGGVVVGYNVNNGGIIIKVSDGFGGGWGCHLLKIGADVVMTNIENDSQMAYSFYKDLEEIVEPVDLPKKFGIDVGAAIYSPENKVVGRLLCYVSEEEAIITFRKDIKCNKNCRGWAMSDSRAEQLGIDLEAHSVEHCWYISPKTMKKI